MTERERRWYDPSITEFKRILDREHEERMRDSRILGEWVKDLDEMGITDLSGRQRQMFPDLMLFYERDQATLKQLVEKAQIAVVLQDRARKRNSAIYAAAALIGAAVGPKLIDSLVALGNHLFH